MKAKPEARGAGTRFAVAAGSLWFDRMMRRFISVGGAAVLFSVLGLFVFVFLQALPLFQGARVQLEASVPWPAPGLRLLALAEDGRQALGAGPEGGAWLVDLSGAGAEAAAVDLGLRPGEPWSSYAFAPGARRLVLGTTGGEVRVFRVAFGASPGEGRVEAAGTPFRHPAGGAVRALDVLAEGETLHLLALAGTGRGAEAQVASWEGEAPGPDNGENGEPVVWTAPEDFAVAGVRWGRHPGQWVGWDGRGEIQVAERRGKRWVVEQRLAGEAAGPALADLQFLAGRNTLVGLRAQTGKLAAWTEAFQEAEERLGYQAKETRFPALGFGPTVLRPGWGNRSFLAIGEGGAALLYGTTGEMRWRTPRRLPASLVDGALSMDQRALVLVDAAGSLHRHGLRDPHPEAGWQGLFGRLHYEGRARPAREWQSTGGTDDYEPKYSLAPLLFGSFKGTVFAMLFSVPMALAAAAYVSQFLHPALRTPVKSVLEFMASVPTVVLGFLGAIWLGPLLAERMAALLAACVLIPGLTLLAGWGWSQAPARWRRKWSPESEIGMVFLLVVTAVGLAWAAEPALEGWLFTVQDPVSGDPVVGFRFWWEETMGGRFEQRNSVGVGIMMGFAVIPVVFTIAEEALTGVPRSLVSGALALGASRWQTMRRVLVPTAATGLLSAVMVGFGRALGETMIVLMATGNTPLAQWDPFLGFRALSANIAIEMPEASWEGSLYRVLFVAASLLVVLSFIVNTLAELLRNRLRERFRALS